MAETLRETLAGAVRLLLARGDITEADTEAIVNAANAHLAHGGGVAAAIVRAGGPDIQRDSDAHVRQHGSVPVGQAAITGAGRLNCEYVIHAVGPRWGEGNEDAKLRSAVQSSLRLAEENGIKSIALPAISSGIFGFPKDRCAQVILEAIADYASGERASLEEVMICLYDAPTVHAFEQAWDARFA